MYLTNRESLGKISRPKTTGAHKLLQILDQILTNRELTKKKIGRKEGNFKV
jgi:tryptophan synthase beta subunit